MPTDVNAGKTIPPDKAMVNTGWVAATTAYRFAYALNTTIGADQHRAVWDGRCCVDPSKLGGQYEE